MHGGTRVCPLEKWRRGDGGGGRRGGGGRIKTIVYVLKYSSFLWIFCFLFGLLSFFSRSLLIGAALEGQRGAQPGQQITHSAAVVRSCQPLNARWLKLSPTSAKLTNSQSILCHDLDEISSPCSFLLYKEENMMKCEQFPTSNQRQNDSHAFFFFNQ